MSSQTHDIGKQYSEIMICCGNGTFVSITSNVSACASVSDVVDIVVEFLEVSIHHLLYLRNLYPRSIFVLRKMYNIPVQVGGILIHISDCFL